MLTYENFVAVLLNAIEQADLNIAYTQELLDTHALGRSLSITCLPQGIEDDRAPEEPPLRAVIAFRWSPEFTVYSLRGAASDSFAGLVDERILASSTGGGLEVDVSYTLPLTDDPLQDLNALPQIARAVHELHASVVPSSENPMRVEVGLGFPAGQAPRIKSLTLLQTWSIADALFDADLLSEVFEDLCGEVSDVLEALAEVYMPDAGASHTPPEAEETPMERRYLKPPTA